MKRTKNVSTYLITFHRLTITLLLFVMHYPSVFGASGSISIQVKEGINVLGCHLTVGNNTIPELFPSAPDDSSIILWIPSHQKFSKEIHYSSHNLWSDKNAKIHPRTGFYFTAKKSFQWKLSGSFPLTKPKDPLWPGNNLLSLKNPSGSDLLSKTGIAPQSGDLLHIWTGSGFTAYHFTKIPGVLENWLPEEPNLKPGMGFNYQSARETYPKERIFLVQRMNDENQWE